MLRDVEYCTLSTIALTVAEQPLCADNSSIKDIAFCHHCTNVYITDIDMKDIPTVSGSKIKLRRKHDFNVQAFLDSPGVSRRVVKCRRSQKIFIQGDPSSRVMYIQKLGPVIWMRGPKVSRGFRSCRYW
jgi:hypothetical protein